MVVTRVTYSFFQTSSNGITARLVRRETVDLLGAREKDVTRPLETESGQRFREILPEYEGLLFAEMGVIKDDFHEYDYYTVSVLEYENPGADELEEVDEDEDEDDEGEEGEDESELDGQTLIVEINAKTGKAKVKTK